MQGGQRGRSHTDYHHIKYFIESIAFHRRVL
jgi:hypothetical protein